MIEKYSPIKEFIDQRKTFPLNNWFYLEGISIYIRKSKRLIEGNLVDCIDVASVNVVNKGRGEFTNFLDWLISSYSSDFIIFVESVLEERLNGFLKRKGFIQETPQVSNNWWLPKVNPHIV